MAKTIVVHVKLFRDFACQILSKLAKFSLSNSKNKSGTVFLRHSVEASIGWFQCYYKCRN